MKSQEEIDVEIRALSDRISWLEIHMGLKTKICAGYCNQPTANPGGICLACQERERHEIRVRMAKERNSR
jgi:hypothetical protein